MPQPAEIWKSLDDVGKTKAVGYLPLYTVRDVLGKDARELAQILQDRGLTAWVLSEEHSSIKSGALFAFDHAMVDVISPKHASLLAAKGWLPDSDEVMSKISTVWFEPDDPVMPLIHELYGD